MITVVGTDFDTTRYTLRIAVGGDDRHELGDGHPYGRRVVTDNAAIAAALADDNGCQIALTPTGPYTYLTDADPGAIIAWLEQRTWIQRIDGWDGDERIVAKPGVIY